MADPGLVLEAINNDREVIGNRDCRAFLLDAAGGREVVLGDGELCTYAVDINDSSTVLAYQVDDSFQKIPYLWSAGVATPLAGVPTGWPIAINNQGQVLLDVDGVSVLWEQGAATELELSDGSPMHAVALNNLGEVVGTTGQPRLLAIWAAGVVTTAPMPQEFYEPMTINDRGEVLLAGGGTASVWTNGTVADLDFGPIDGWYVEAEAMNNAGVVVGTMDVYQAYAMAPFALRGDRMFRFAQAGRATDINDHGDVIGAGETGRVTGGPHGPWSWLASSRWSAVWSLQPLEFCQAAVPSN